MLRSSHSLQLPALLTAGGATAETVSRLLVLFFFWLIHSVINRCQVPETLKLSVALLKYIEKYGIYYYYFAVH